MRLISLNPTITQSLVLLSRSDNLVGITSFCTKYLQNKKISEVGTAINFSIEKLISLEPDLVFASGLSPLKKCLLLEKSGVNILKFSPPCDYSEIRKQFLTLAKSVDAIEKANHILEICDEKVNKLTRKQALKTVFFQVGKSPLFTVPEKNYLNDLITRAGGINIAKEFKSGRISREEVIAGNPDIIIVAGMGSLKGMEEVDKWQSFNMLKAVKTNKVFYLRSEEQACSPQPEAFAEALSELAELINN